MAKVIQGGKRETNNENGNLMKTLNSDILSKNRIKW